jgi:hypothetical protein
MVVNIEVVVFWVVVPSSIVGGNQHYRCCAAPIFKAVPPFPLQYLTNIQNILSAVDITLKHTLKMYV